MKKQLLLLSAFLSTGTMLHAQAVTAVTGLRLYEHHSPLITGSQSANGTQSGYDFVNRAYYHSYNTANFGKYMNGEEANIDMVEHNGPYGNGQNGGKFGFTSGMSTIWVNEIQGNGITKWMKAPSSFNYTTLNNVSQIAAAYDGATATQSIPTVEENTVYLGRIRNTALYVAMRTTTVKNRVTGDNDVYFNFEYKYGTLSTTGVSNLSQSNELSIYPNPASNSITIENKGTHVTTASIVSSVGQQVMAIVLEKGDKQSVATNGLASGMYFVNCVSADGVHHTYKLMKQ